MEFKQEGDILSAAVDYWLSGNVPDVPITWESVVEALESDYVGEPGCATKIRTKYCQHENSNEKGLIMLIYEVSTLYRYTKMY